MTKWCGAGAGAQTLEPVPQPVLVQAEPVREADPTHNAAVVPQPAEVSEIISRRLLNREPHGVSTTTPPLGQAPVPSAAKTRASPSVECSSLAFPTGEVVALLSNYHILQISRRRAAEAPGSTRDSLQLERTKALLIAVIHNQPRRRPLHPTGLCQPEVTGSIPVRSIVRSCLFAACSCSMVPPPATTVRAVRAVPCIVVDPVERRRVALFVDRSQLRSCNGPALHAGVAGRATMRTVSCQNRRRPPAQRIRALSLARSHELPRPAAPQISPIGRNTDTRQD